MFACVLPGVISFLCGFYCLLHAWLNAFAEMLKFGDRLFYEVISTGNSLFNLKFQYTGILCRKTLCFDHYLHIININFDANYISRYSGYRKSRMASNYTKTISINIIIRYKIIIK